MAKATKKNPKLMKTEFSLSAPQATSVFIAGDFNQWNLSAHLLKKINKESGKVPFYLTQVSTNTDSL